MDILRKELNRIYVAQRLADSVLPPAGLERCKAMADTLVGVSGGCTVITDAACDRCYVYSGGFGRYMGFATDGDASPLELCSSDEDLVYNRIHPEDLVDKRMLEFEFFKLADRLPPDEKMSVKAVCHLRMRDRSGEFVYVDNSTQVVCLSPEGKIWLILCCYDISPRQQRHQGITPAIIGMNSGLIQPQSFETQRRCFLSDREKEILKLIRDGRPSKQIAALLGISVNTVSRHRQNIIAKLSVGNSIEAVTAATAMNLL